MALNQFSNNVYPNLYDWASVVDPDGSIAKVAWLLAQSNAILTDMVLQEGNLPLGHSISVNAGLPQGTWRQNNQGVAASKPLFAKYQFSIGMLQAYSMVDKVEAELNGDVGKFRLLQDQSHIEGLSQQVASAMFYASEYYNPSQFTGFSTYYNSLEQNVAQTAKNVINAGGSGSSNASMWVVGWGDNTTYAIHPKGTPAGLVYENKGDIVPLYDGAGNRYEGYTSLFAWKIGLAIKNWQYNVRIANIDTTTAGVFGTNPYDLFIGLAEAVTLLPTFNARVSNITKVDSPDPAPGINAAIYVNRKVRTALDIQAQRDKNVLLRLEEFAGMAVDSYRGVPIRVVDALISTEATIS